MTNLFYANNFLLPPQLLPLWHASCFTLCRQEMRSPTGETGRAPSPEERRDDKRQARSGPREKEKIRHDRLHVGTGPTPP